MKIRKISIKKADVIKIYRDDNNDIRWTRTGAGNHKIIGASTEGYKTMRSAMANIKRTQKGPYTIVNNV